MKQPKSQTPVDKRYTINQEFCGYDEPRFVVRYCGEFVASHTDYETALLECSLNHEEG